ncbi:MAG: DNA internalization-related competence protein ComEC/Rec2 [Cellulosilyticaceae bacterium]
MNNLQVPFLIGIGCLIMVNTIVGYKYGFKASLIFFSISMLGIISVKGHPVILERALFKDDRVMQLMGTVVEKKINDYGEQFVLDQVVLVEKNNKIFIKSKVAIQTSQSSKYEVQDRLKVKGKVLQDSVQMNPSDMDYLSYLRGEGIVVRLKSTDLKKIGQDRAAGRKSYKVILRQIQRVFQNKDRGIVAGVLLGDDEWIAEEVDELYFTLGIGHILALSGFHLGIITIIMMWLCKRVGLSYYTRQIVVLMGIWGYTLFTGAASSTIRASIMATIILIARCLWEEEDMPTSIALAAIVILMGNPFQLYQVGFQLSFVAIISICISSILIEELEEHYKPNKKVKQVLNYVLPPLSIFLGISPVLAYHFFEFPLLGTLLNFVILPIFALIIPYMIICLGISLIHIELARALGMLVNYTLNSINIIGEQLLEYPLMTLCIGRPSIGSIVLYYSLLIITLLGITRKMQIKQGCIIVVSLAIVPLVVSIGSENYLQITQLYVGQGDASVVVTPRKRAVLIDGGPMGKGNTVERFLKYSGINQLTSVVLSHPHDDHISGVIELIQSGVMVENVIVPSGFIIEGLLKTLYEECSRSGIDIYEVDCGGSIAIDNVAFKWLWPNSEAEAVEVNEHSAVLLLEFGEFQMLYTGDIGKETELKLSDRLEDIEVLKIAHHGSKNSTDSRFLLQTKPEYAMISCGINNLYGHPHQETLETLGAYPVKCLRTDRNGAITIDVDGYNDIKVRSQIQEDKRINEGDLRD